MAGRKRAEIRVAKALRNAAELALQNVLAGGEGRIPDMAGIALSVALVQAWRAAIRSENAKAQRDLGALDAKAEGPSFWERFAQEYVQQFGAQAIGDILETTRAHVLRAVDRGLRDGKGIDAIAREIRDAIPALARKRAAIIARTETHSAAQYASLQTAKTYPFPVVKIWNSIADHRTRDFGEGDGVIDDGNHRAMDGVTVALSEPFMIPNKLGGQDALQFPGDPSGPSYQVVNCRCAMSYRRAARSADDVSMPKSPPPAPRRALTYKTITPPKTVAQAEAFLVNNRVSEAASLSAIKAKLLPAAAVAALEVTERFDLPPIQWIGTASRFGFKPIKGATAAIVRINRRNRQTGEVTPYNGMHMSGQFSEADFARQKQIAEEKAASYRNYAKQELENNSDTSSDVLRRFRKMKVGEYSWTHSNTQDPDGQARAVVYHEYGHVLHLIDQKMGSKIDEFLRVHSPRREGWQFLLSKYGGTNDKEYVAEAFALYMSAPSGQHYRIHPALLKVFQEGDAESGD